MDLVLQYPRSGALTDQILSGVHDYLKAMMQSVQIQGQARRKQLGGGRGGEEISILGKEGEVKGEASLGMVIHTCNPTM